MQLQQLKQPVLIQSLVASISKRQTASAGPPASSSIALTIWSR